MDKIDEFLLKEFGIMGGCCSAAKSLEYNVARRVAERLWWGVFTSKDLEEAAKEYKENNPFAGYSVENDYCAGAKWKEQQLKAKAVDGVVICDEKLTHGYRDIVFKFPEELKVGDKVKMIIIKEQQ